ncbi:MAG: hypothetical protein ABSA91_01985 [Acidimicrobiales bacterium]
MAQLLLWATWAAWARPFSYISGFLLVVQGAEVNYAYPVFERGPRLALRAFPPSIVMGKL